MNRRGFTLLEVLIATVIMGVAVAGLIAGLSQSVKNAARLTDYDRAVMLARTKMNDLLIDADLPFDGAVEGQFGRELSGGVASGWRAALRPFDVPPRAGPGTKILQRVALEVWWEPPSGSRRTIQLESYRTISIPAPARAQ
jgi:general secretion pathway protein I